MKTVELLEEIRLDVVHLAQYSTRPHTTAERNLVDDVPAEEKDRRFRFLEAQHERITGEINQRFLGQAVQVLVEGEHKGKWRGRTPQNKLAFFEDRARDWRGQVARVGVDWVGPWSMRGSVVCEPGIQSAGIHSHTHRRHGTEESHPA